MPPKSQSSQPKPSTQKKIKPTRVNLAKLDAPSHSTKRINPLTAFKSSSQSLPSQRDRDGDTLLLSQGTVNGKQVQSGGKGKEKARLTLSPLEDIEDRLWVDIYEPTTEAELAVHVRKVEDVRRWLVEAFDGGPSGKLKKYRRILALTGPAGTGKTSTIRVLAREMGFDILEWRNSVGEAFSGFDASSSHASTGQSQHPNNHDQDFESLFTKFEAFLNRATNCQSIFSHSTSGSSSKSASQSAKPSPPQRRIVLLEDLPNILHAQTQASFHASLKALVDSSPSSPPVPVIIVVSNAGMRGEANDDRMTSGGGWGRDKEQVVDVRTVLSKDLLGGPYVTQIMFNPIAPTLLRKALQALLQTHFASHPRGMSAPSNDVLNITVESANGDIRSAIMAMQFACVVQLPSKSKRKGTKLVLESVTRREQSLVLFHLMGKVLYNKRKGDPPNPSATAKDLAKERDIDALLKDPPKLPPHLEEHERRCSRVDVDTLYADSPIDSSLFSLYIHQNYTQFCTEMEEAEGVADWLSWVDSSGGEAWYQANPHRFHLLTLGTLHSLPSPVPRRSQKVFKPEFFNSLQREKDARDAVTITREWIAREDLKVNAAAKRVGGWSRTDVILELGGILKAREAVGGRSPSSQAPPAHQLFSKMTFVRGGDNMRLSQLDEADTGAAAQVIDEGYDEDECSRTKEEKDGGWLVEDDIQDFD